MCLYEYMYEIIILPTRVLMLVASIGEFAVSQLSLNQVQCCFPNLHGPSFTAPPSPAMLSRHFSLLPRPCALAH